MAISNSDGSIVLTTKVDQSGLKKGMGSISGFAKSAGKALAAVGAAAATATVAITKMAVSAYADYEQLVGGVETLFKGSADKVMKYAENAFATAGISANEYMRQVTSFSASLISSTAGDTEKAADIADMALTDMADNANKMGTPLENIQTAYQGFAKQQYMLLDNLKLGYGGTKTEMERLLKDAENYSKVELGKEVSFDISNLADVYTAINLIQQKLDITGTTAKEAEETISGSAAMMKASWQNVLSAIAGGGDLDRAINNLVYSIQTYFNNIVPVVERALQGIGQLIEQVAPMLVQTVARSLIKAIPSLLNAVYQMILGLAKGIYQGIVDLFSGSTTDTIEKQTNQIQESVDNQNELTEAVEETNEAVKRSVAPFDEVNQVTKETAENESSVGGVSVGGISSAYSGELNKMTADTETATTKMQSAFSKVAEELKKVWNIEPVQAFVGAAVSYGKFYIDSWKQFGTDLYNNITTTWGNIKENVGIATKNMTDLWTQFWQDIQTGIDTWGQPIINSMSNLFNSIWSTAIDPSLQIITQRWADYSSILLDLWNEYGGVLVNNIGEFVNTTIGLFQSIYDNVIEPIITPFLEMFSELWDKHLKGLIEDVGYFVMELVNFVFEIYNKFIAPIINVLLEVLSPVIRTVANFVSGIIGTVFGVISDVVGGILRALGGVIEFIRGVFAGDWEKAWNGIKNVFSGIFNAIWGIVKGVINLIIDGLNLLWGAVYSVVSGIVNAVGGIAGAIGEIFGQDWKFSMPKEFPTIPKLATGTVVPPNREFLAILGDNKSETEVVSPLSTIKQAVAEVVAEMGVNGGFNGRIEVPVNIDGRQIARAVREAESGLGVQTVFGGFANAY